MKNYYKLYSKILLCILTKHMNEQFHHMYIIEQFKELYSMLIVFELNWISFNSSLWSAMNTSKQADILDHITIERLPIFEYKTYLYNNTHWWLIVLKEDNFLLFVNFKSESKWSHFNLKIWVTGRTKFDPGFRVMGE